MVSIGELEESKNHRAKSYIAGYAMYVYVCALFIERQMAWEIIDQIYLWRCRRRRLRRSQAKLIKCSIEKEKWTPLDPISSTEKEYFDSLPFLKCKLSLLHCVSVDACTRMSPTYYGLFFGFCRVSVFLLLSTQRKQTKQMNWVWAITKHIKCKQMRVSVCVCARARAEQLLHTVQHRTVHAIL